MATLFSLTLALFRRFQATQHVIAKTSILKCLSRTRSINSGIEVGAKPTECRPGKCFCHTPRNSSLLHKAWKIVLGSHWHKLQVESWTIFLLHKLNFVGRESLHALHKKCLTFIGTLSFHNMDQKLFSRLEFRLALPACTFSSHKIL